jgi:hypothetical protein
MKQGSILTKSLVIIILMTLLAVTACAAAPATPTSPPPKAAITLDPNVVTLNKERTIVVQGSGFTSGTSVNIGIPEVIIDKTKSELWMGAEAAGKDGTFKFSAALSGLYYNNKPGTYTVIALNSKGEEAKATLTVKEAEKK